MLQNTHSSLPNDAISIFLLRYVVCMGSSTYNTNMYYYLYYTWIMELYYAYWLTICYVQAS